MIVIWNSEFAKCYPRKILPEKPRISWELRAGNEWNRVLKRDLEASRHLGAATKWKVQAFDPEAAWVAGAPIEQKARLEISCFFR